MSRLYRLTALALVLLTCTQCASYHWTPKAPDGTPLSTAQAHCRAKAAESARKQLPFGGYDMGLNDGIPADSARDIEQRETAACLKKMGFKLVRDQE